MGHMAGNGGAGLRESVLRALSTVTDPEIDEPITDLGFVREITIGDGRVSVDIVTSTFWCSPNFVYMMLEDARNALVSLPWVREAQVTLGGHHDAERINEAINAGKSFEECYGAEASGDLVLLNRMFQERALRGRLYDLATTLAKYGFTPEALMGLRVEDLNPGTEDLVVRWTGRAAKVRDPADLIRLNRYLTFLGKLGIRSGPLVVWDLEGKPPPFQELEAFLTRSRSVKLNLGLNAELCRALLKARLEIPQGSNGAVQ